MIIFMYVRVYTQRLGTPITSQHNIFYSEKLSQVFLCSRRGSNLGSLDLESDALSIELPRHAVCEYANELSNKAESSSGSETMHT